MSNASRSVAWERIIPLATLLLLSLLAAGPLWGPGLLNTRGGGDSPFLLLRTHQLVANLRAGVFPVRWMPDAAYGFGYPFFSYYAALPYYVAAGLELLGLDILTAIKLTQTLFLAASALTMYRWAEQVLHSRPGAWLAAVAYTAAPFHLVNLYVRGDSLSEFAAFAFYPLILWGFDRLASRPSLRRALVPALAYAGLIVTHNVSALIFSPLILLYVAFHVARAAVLGPDRSLGKAIGRCSLLALPLLIALLLSSWFWLPALAETKYVQLTAQTSGYFFYGNHFRGTDLVQRRLLFDYATGQDDISPFAMGLAQSALALAGVLIVSFRGIRSRFTPRDGTSEAPGPQLRKRHPTMAKLGFALLGLLLSTWLITPLSRPLWDHLPLLPMVQFPWRFLSIQALFVALLTGGAVSHITVQRRHLVWAGAIALGAALMTTNLISLRPTYLPISADNVNSERLRLYELFTGNIGSTIRHEYLPTWVRPRPYIGAEQLSPDASPRAIPIRGALLSAERSKRKPTRRVWHVEAGDEGSEVAFPLYYWPGWHALVDGTRLEVEPTPGSGYVSLYVPPGSHAVEIRLGRTPLRLGAELVSLITAVTVVALTVKKGNEQRTERRQREREQGKREPPRRRPGSTIRNCRAAIPYLPFVITLSLLTAFHPRVTSSSSRDLTMDFEEMPYLHHNPGGVPFDGWELISYSYGNLKSSADDAITAGKTLTVTLNWRRDEGNSRAAPAKAPTKLRLISPAAVRHNEIPATAEAAIRLDQRQSAPGIAGSTVVTLSVPQETAPGIHLLQIDDGPTGLIAQTPSPLVTLRPVWIETDRTSTGEPVHATFAEGALRLHDVRVTQLGADRLNVQLDWSATEPVAANYGLSLSLTDTAGNEWLHQGDQAGYDTQPGHGFLPTSLWPSRRVIHDHHVPALMPGIPPGDAYTLAITLYQVATWRSVGQYSMTVALTKTVQRPDPLITAQLGEDLVLSRIEMPGSISQGESLQMTAYWSTVKKPSENYVVEWQLKGVGQSITSTQPLAPGSSPREWPAGAWIAGRTALAIPPTFPPGEYTLSLTLKEPGRGTRIGSYTHPTPITVRERERVWKLPEMEESVRARFGDMIELAGYDLKRGRENVHLTLYWQAMTTPDVHYAFFVHLADPETGEPASQVDAMPRGFTYPTGQWAAGEVISDEVELSTKDVAAGRYDLAVGWYDPDTKQRLQAVDSEGKPLPDDRLLLPHTITLP